MNKRRVAALSLALFLILGLIPTAWAVQREDLVVNEQNEKYGVVDKEGRVILPTIYDYVSIGENGTIRVSLYTGERGTEGLYSWEGEEILPIVYSHISTQEDGNLEVGMEVTQESGETQIKCGLLDPRGNVLLPIVYDRIGDLSEGRRPVYLNDKAGYLDENFQLVIPYQYDYASRFEHGLAQVRQGMLYGVIDREGKEVLPCIYNDIVIYEDGIIKAGRYSDQGARYGLFDREGREILPMEYDSINGSGDDDYFLLRKWGETSVAEGLADREGNIILPMVYQGIDQTTDGCWLVIQNDKCGVLDREFQPLIPLNYDSIFEAEGHEDYYTVCRNDRWGLLDREGKVVLPLEYDELDWVEEDVCLAAKGGKTGLLRCPGGEVLAPFVYDEVSRWNRNYLVVTQNGLMGALDRKTGAVLVPVEFVGVSEWGEGYTGPDNVIITRKSNLFGAYDETGKELFPCQFGTLERLSAALRSGSTDLTGVGDTSRAAGLQVDWYPEADRITRIYGSDRMALMKNGRYALFGLDGTQYTDYVFDAIGEQRAPGEFMAAQNGKWGIIDSSGTPLTDFFWETQQEAREEVGAKFVSRWADGSPPYALFDKSGTRLTNYKFWSYEPFSLGVSWVSDGTAYGLVDAAGRELTPFQYDIVEPFQEDGFSIVYQYEGPKYNAVDTTGRELWSQAEPYAKIWRAGHGLWGRGYPMGTVTFWNERGEQAIPGVYHYSTDPKGFMQGGYFDENGVAWVYLESGESTFIDIQGNQVEAPTDRIKEENTDLHEGLIWARRDQRQLSGDWEMEKGWGFQNAEGELTVPYLYDAVGYFDQGYASVRLDGVYGLLRNPAAVAEEEKTLEGLDILWLDGAEGELFPLGSDQMILDNVIRGTNGEKAPLLDTVCGLWSIEGEHLLTAEQADAMGGTAWGPDGNQIYTFPSSWEIVDKNAPRLDMRYTDILGRTYLESELWGWDAQENSPESDYCQAVSPETGKWGFLDKTGQPISQGFVWDEARAPNEDTFEVRQGDSWGIIDLEGNEVVPFLFDNIHGFIDGIAIVTFHGRQGILRDPRLRDEVSDWATDEISAATSAGYVTESCRTYQTFTITRRQFAELAVNYMEKALGEPITPAPADTFTDTTDEGILKAYAAGIVQGVGEGKFSPGGLLTREQLATMLWRAMERAGAGMHIGGMNEYTDWDQVSDWAQNALNNLVCHEVMQGTSATTLSPKDSCTVEQAILLVLRAYEKDYPTPAERQAWHEAALDRVSVQGLAIGTPLDQLPGELRSVLSPVGQPYDGWATEPRKEIAQHYEAPGITIITSRATEEVLRRMVEINDEDYLMEKLGTTDQAAILERELGREYVEKIILTSDAYALVSGLKVGDSEERARALGHVSLNGENVGGYGSTEITWEDGVVTQIEVWDYIGRRVGPFFDP